MLTIGLIKEGKVPSDNRVALSPKQCKWIHTNWPQCKVIVQSSASRCYSDEEYVKFGIEVKADVSQADILLGIKEVPKEQFIANKTYLFFSHTKKAQPYNQQMFKTMMKQNITLIDYECLEHEDGQRIIGFGFFAGIVGAHNGIMCYGNRTKQFELGRVFACKDYRHLIHSYFGLKLPPLKIAVTGSGRVAHGILEVMNLLDIQEVEPDEYLTKQFAYPVYVHLKGADLYTHKHLKTYQRDHFHLHPEEYDCIFSPFMFHTDILMNGIYWDARIPALFALSDLSNPKFAIKTIADITDDAFGSVPCNLGDATIEHPVYGVDKQTYQKTAPYTENVVDVMAVGNLPNELARDASSYFGDQLIKYILKDLITNNSPTIHRATILKNGKLNEPFSYLHDYAS